MSSDPSSTLVERRLRYIERQRALQREAAARDAAVTRPMGTGPRQSSRHADGAHRPAGRAELAGARPGRHARRVAGRLAARGERPLRAPAVVHVGRVPGAAAGRRRQRLPLRDHLEPTEQPLARRAFPDRWPSWPCRPAEARFVSCTGYDVAPGTTIPYTTNLALARAVEDDVLLVHTWEGHPLPREHGGPCRMITPKLYAWKGTKWIRRIEFLAEDRPGLLGGARLLQHRRAVARRSLLGVAPPNACSPRRDLRPMLAIAPDEPPPLEDARLVYEPKYDGIRAIVLVEPGPHAVRPSVVAQRQREVARSFPSWSRRSPAWAAHAGRSGGARRRDRGARRHRDAGRVPAAAGPHQRLRARLPIVGAETDTRRAAHGARRLRPAARRRRGLRARSRCTERRAALEARCGDMGSPLLRLTRPGGRRRSGPVRRGAATPGLGRPGGQGASTRPIAPGKRSPEWRKLKIQQQDEFVVAGWTEPRGTRTRFGALILGAHDADGDARRTSATSAPASPRRAGPCRGAARAAGHRHLLRSPCRPRLPGKAHWVRPRARGAGALHRDDRRGPAAASGLSRAARRQAGARGEGATRGQAPRAAARPPRNRAPTAGRPPPATPARRRSAGRLGPGRRRRHRPARRPPGPPQERQGGAARRRDARRHQPRQGVLAARASAPRATCCATTRASRRCCCRCSTTGRW